MTPASTPLARGQQVGRFRIEREVAGGDALAWLAIDPATGGRFTLERVPEASPEALEAWREDRQRLARLGVSSLPSTTEEIEAAGWRLAVGPAWGEAALPDLDPRRVGRGTGARPALGRVAALALARDFARALAAAHKAGVVHGDLRAQDVRRTARGVQLVRFGAWRARVPDSSLEDVAAADVEALLGILEPLLARRGGLGALARVMASRPERSGAVSAEDVVAALEDARRPSPPSVKGPAVLIVILLAVGIGLLLPAKPRPEARVSGAAAENSEPDPTPPPAQRAPPPLPMPAEIPLDPPRTPDAGDLLIGRWRCRAESKELTNDVVYGPEGLFQSRGSRGDCDGTWRAIGIGVWRQTGACTTRRGRPRAILSELRLDTLGRVRVQDAGAYPTWICLREPAS